MCSNICDTGETREPGNTWKLMKLLIQVVMNYYYISYKQSVSIVILRQRRSRHLLSLQKNCSTIP